ncbi:MAG: hypothetical protein VX899_12165 [Myxococcota bacterium]|nr:hypothetical protein [Myxococcota bacterium]
MLFALAFAACNPGGVTAEDAQAFVQQQATQVNPAGRVGLELIGKGQWVKGPQFDRECLMSKDLAFTDQGNTISPTYENQHFLTTATDKGWCVYMGQDIQVEVGTPTRNQDAWAVPLVYSLGTSTPWAECLRSDFRNRSVNVVADESGQLRVVDEDLRMFRGDCPQPMPKGEVRAASQAPKAKAPKTPSKQEAVAALKAFDEAIYSRDWQGALEHISCYNLLEEGVYGSCTPSDLLQVGPHPRGQERAGDGSPWTEYALSDLGDFKAVRAGKEGMVHVVVEHKRTRKLRSVSLEWTGSEWKVVGIIHRQGHDLTTVRFLNDLHNAEKWSIFQRRVAGEKIDEKGEVLPGFEEEEE